ncbi:hypothetical protein VNI00_008548 [Paramarasmius palmivorus]|uniref:F-box domain-containing protein n=1 Tax=Paramarasmius palmivorus TaxID=297713 RepID=A0AAW0CVN3_9AGAR
MSLPPSPFLSKLQTNFFASPAEKVEIHHLISTRRDRLHAIEDEIARLRAEQVELQTFVDEHLTLVPPIRQVPIDILRGIFLQCMPETGFPACRALEAPLVFTGVCRLWREVAISTPTLWNRMYIHLPAPTPDGQPITERFLAYLHLWREGVMLWLRRSGTAPLVLSISSGYEIWGEEQVYHRFHADVVLQLLEYTSRWKSLSLNIPERIWRIVTALTADLPLLEALTVHYLPFDAKESYQNFMKTVLQRIPSLHKLCLSQLPDNLPIRWDRLTEVSLTDQDQALRASQAIQILLFSCSSLRHFAAYLTETDVQPTFSPITLPRLQTLNIEVVSFFVSPPITPIPYQHPSDAPELIVQHFLDCIDAPNLVNFSLNWRSSQTSLTTLVGFLEHSGCALRSLVLSISEMASTEMIDLLASMPSLVQLKLRPILREIDETPWSAVSDWHLPGMLIDSLTPSQANLNGNVLCPNLEFLVFQESLASHALPIIALAEARCAEDSRTQKLKRLQLHIIDHIIVDDMEVTPRLEALRKRGMLVKADLVTHSYTKSVTTSPEPDFYEHVHSGELWYPEP